MKVINKTSDGMISIVIPIELSEMDGIFSSIFLRKITTARKDFPFVSFFFSPSTQRASEISKFFNGDIENIQKIMPRYNWTLEQEIEKMIGIVLVPTDETSGYSMMKTLEAVSTELNLRLASA